MLTKEILKKSESGIDNSEFYAVIVTENMLKDEKCLYEWNYAKLMKKPFLLIIKEGTKIPEELLNGVNIVYRGYFETKEDMDKIGSEMNKIINTK